MSITRTIKTRFLKRKQIPAKNRDIVLKRPEFFSKILVVLNAEDEALRNYAATVFKNAEINVLYPRSNKQDKSPSFCFSVHPSDFNLTGGLKNDKLARLLQTEFDLLIDLSDDSRLLKYLAQSINASLVIGTLEMTQDGLCDLFFEKRGTDSEFLEEIIKQLNQLIKK